MILRAKVKPLLSAALLAVLWLVGASCGAQQQVVERGPLGKPTQMLDETGQWTTPLLAAHDSDVGIYIPDVSNPDWLKQNYPDFRDKYQYVLTFLTFYRTPRACKANMIGWGYSDAAHLDACETEIGYRIRRASVDTHLKTVTLIMAAMVDTRGQIVPASIEQQPISRNWSSLDENTQEALNKATALITEQMKIYDRRVNGNH